MNMTKCEIRWCGRQTRNPVTVNENIGDGCFSVDICPSCAKALNLKPGQDLPDPTTVRRTIKAKAK